MREFVILCEGEEFPEENVRALENAMQGFVQTDIPLCVEFIFVDGEEIRRLNREMRDTDKVTDVLSFPALEAKPSKVRYLSIGPFQLLLKAFVNLGRYLHFKCGLQPFGLHCLIQALNVPAQIGAAAVFLSRRV